MGSPKRVKRVLGVRDVAVTEGTFEFCLLQAQILPFYVNIAKQTKISPRGNGGISVSYSLRDQCFLFFVATAKPMMPVTAIAAAMEIATSEVGAEYPPHLSQFLGSCASSATATAPQQSYVAE